MRFSTLDIVSLLVPSVFAITSALNGALVVGSHARHKTVQSAVDLAQSGATIFIEPGTYNEQVYIPAGKNNLKIIGWSENDNAYSANKVTITQNRAQDSPDKPNNDNTATLRAWGDGLKLYNVNLVNSRGQGSQALALSAYGDKMGFYACQFTGFQDTVMSQSGHHYISKSLIVGATDFIFGQYGVLWVEKSTVQVLNAGTGYITANGRLDGNNPSYYVINDSTITGNSAAGTYYLGRPWRNWARVAFQNTAMSAVINKDGYSVWGSSDPRTDKVTFAEYHNTGPGSVGPRAQFVQQLSKPLTLGGIFGEVTEWIDAAWL